MHFHDFISTRNVIISDIENTALGFLDYTTPITERWAALENSLEFLRNEEDVPAAAREVKKIPNMTIVQRLAESATHNPLIAYNSYTQDADRKLPALAIGHGGIRVPLAEINKTIANAIETDDTDFFRAAVNRRRTLGLLLDEYAWYTNERPFYNVYPVIEKLIANTNLAAINISHIELPVDRILFRFAAGYEPFGIKSILVGVGQPKIRPTNWDNYAENMFQQITGFTALNAQVQFVDRLADGSCYESYPLAQPAVWMPDNPAQGSVVLSAAGRYTRGGSNTNEAPAIPFRDFLGCQVFVNYPHPARTAALSADSDNNFSINVEPIAETIARQYREDEFAAAARLSINSMRDRPKNMDVHMFVYKLVAVTSLLHKGHDLITPIVLSKHQERYDKTADQAEKELLAKKAAQIQGRGWSIGKELQNQADTNPHIRNAHWALYWTGVGRKEPRLVFRRGCKVSTKHLAQVPTGFLGEEQKHEEDAPKTKIEYVYLMQSPVDQLIKIGKTTNLEQRQAAGKTWVPGGLKLRGVIKTADSTALETRLHREYATYRRTNEFFELTDDHVTQILTALGGEIPKEGDT